MTAKYRVFSEGRLTAIAFVGPNNADSRCLVAIIMPIEHTGSWEGNNREMTFRKFPRSFFSSHTPDSEVLNRLLTGAGMEPKSCVVARVPLAENGPLGLM